MSNKILLTIVGVSTAALLTFFGWVTLDLHAASKKNVEQDVILKYTNQNIETIQKDLRDIKVHFLKQGN